jgi:hypothetical protein
MLSENEQINPYGLFAPGSALTDNAQRYRSDQGEWLNFSESTINKLIKMMADSRVTFEELYRFTAKQRGIIAQKLGHVHLPGTTDSSAYGQFRDAVDGMLADSFETFFNKECEQPWPRQKQHIFAAVNALVENRSNWKSRNVHIERSEINTPLFSDGRMIIDQGSEEFVIDISQTLGRDIYDLSRIVFVHNPHNISEDVIQIFYTDLEVLPMSIGFEFLNKLYRSMMSAQVTDCKESRQSFLKNLGKLMHFMANFMPTLRGNASCCEWIMRAAGFNKGIEIGEFNLEAGGLSWDLKALITPDPTVYADWFSKEAILDMVVNCGPEKSHSLTL